MTNINIHLVHDMVFLEYICKLLLSIRYLSKNGCFNTLKSSSLINADHYSPRKGLLNNNKKKRDLVKKMASVRSKKLETVVLRRIYIKHIKCSNDSSRLWWNWQFCEKRSENWSRPIPSIGLGRQTTTTTKGCITVPSFCGWVSPISAANGFLPNLLFLVACDECRMRHNLLFLVDIIMN